MYATLFGWEQFLRNLVVLEESVSNILPRRLRSLFYASQFSMKLATPAVVHFMLLHVASFAEKLLLQRRAFWTQQVYPPSIQLQSL